MQYYYSMFIASPNRKFPRHCNLKIRIIIFKSAAFSNVLCKKRSGLLVLCTLDILVAGQSSNYSFTVSKCVAAIFDWFLTVFGAA